MKKRLLSIITSVSLVASALTFGASAAPALAGTPDTAIEYVPYVEFREETSDSVLHSSGPAAVTVADSAEELNTEFGTPEIWDASLMDELSGDGTEESPYLISTADDLMLMANNINTGVGTDAYYRLTADIDLGGIEWTPMGYATSVTDEYDVTTTDYSTTFKGTFDGKGHTVSNFKITKDDTAYIGFFGFVAGGNIKNISIEKAVITISSSSTERLYVGGLVGRMVTITPDSLSSIINCNVTDSSITASSSGTVCAGGIAGSVVSGDYKNASIFLAFSHTRCDISISTDADNITSEGPHMAVAGGIIGRLSSKNNSTVTAINCSADGNILADTTDSASAQPLAGGAFGDLSTVDGENGGTMTINSCYSKGAVTALSDYYPYVAGGFTSQIYPTKNLTINDCYSSANVSGKFLQAGGGDGNDPTAGGFVGQLFFKNYMTSYGKTIKNCYASGDVVDLGHTETTPKDYSFVGGFMAWSTAGVFENCYRFEAQNVVGSDLNYSDFGNINVLSAEDSKYTDKYTGFDMTKIWEMDPEAEYFYPTLRVKKGYVNFISEGVSFTTDVFDADGRVSAPEKTPEKDKTVDKVFTFEYWSLSENGAMFNFGGDKLTESTNLYAVFSSAPRPYIIKFINNGNSFISDKSINYGSAIIAPTAIPSKPDSDQYYYTFLHWSDTEGGDKYDFTGKTVIGDMTFYAVYEAVDKSAWTGGVAESFASGFGTEELPYIITSGDELALLSSVINENKAGYTDAYYALGDDINLGGKVWTPIGNTLETPFSAHFDGRGYSIGNFKVADNKYAGLFGLALNSTIKDLYVSNFEVNLTLKSNITKDAYYIGGLAGYIASSRKDSMVSGIRVSAVKFNINASVDYIFAGNIAGYASASDGGETKISDSFGTSSITAINKRGYNYIGGIVGRLDINQSSFSSITHCYTMGDLVSEALHSSRVGGIAGYLFSYGSNYVGATSSDDDEVQDNPTLSAEDDDIDIMISQSFAITNISSLSTEYNSQAGAIVGERNQCAGADKVFYPMGLGLKVEAKSVDGTDSVKIDKTGYGIDIANLTNPTKLSSSLGFDVENVWTFISGYDYPVLKCMVSDKSTLKVVNASLIDGTLYSTVQVLSNADKYTVIIGVYNTRNQPISIERKQFSDTDSLAEIELVYEDMQNADYILVSAIDKTSMKPLFDSIRYEI